MLDPGPEVPLNRGPASDAIRHNTDNYHNYGGAMNFGARARKTAQNYENFRRWDGAGWQFGSSGETNVEDDSGVCSPPLWKTSPGASPHRDQNNYRYLSPASKAQAIARGQRELMDMIRNMPESSYELSLKDLVEQQHQPRNDIRHESTVTEERTNSGTEVLYRKEKKEKKRKNENNNNKKAQMMRSGSMDKGGFLLKMVFPISFGSKNKKKINSSATKVSPKPQASSDGSAKGVDKEWWKKRFSVSGESESGGTSSTSGSTGSSGSSRSSSSGSRSSSNRNRSDSSFGCWSFFRTKKSKMEK